jgi:hypothetical protein
VNRVISAQSKVGIDFIFDKAVRKSLILNSGDVCDIEPLAEGKGADLQDKDIFVLTISSFLFRVLTIFHIGEDLETRNYFFNNAAEKSFEEVFSEICNLCCGAMNQELLRYFPHLGMSTPYMLNGRCLPFLNELKPGYLSYHAITINGAVRLHATICVCAYAPIDFAVDQTAVADTSGELELF